MTGLSVYAYNTRYEIHNYNLGDIPIIEKELSLWDDVYYRPIPKYHYDEERKILYVPRGYDYVKLSELTGTSIVYKREANPRKKASYSLLMPPKNDIQKEAVRFLAGLEEYDRMKGESQQVLSLPTGEGKTYCSIAGCCMLGVKALVIVGTDDLRKQWKQKITEYTGLPSSSICMIIGRRSIDAIHKASDKKIGNYAFYITTHTTLQSFMKTDGFDKLNPLFEKMGIGVKIIDEAHLQYQNILMIDYATNVWKSIYLTATFGQSEKVDDILFQRAFNKIFKLSKEPTNRKHVIYIAAMFSSKANAVEKESVKGRKGLDKYKYISYEIDKGFILTHYEYFINLLLKNWKLEGKLVVLSPKKESCDLLKEITSNILPDYSSCVHYSGNKVENFDEYGIIFATPKMLGTGNDISGLRAIINLEPIRSKRNTLQLFGRLREYAPDKDTYYVELIDKSIPSVSSMHRDRRGILMELCKKYMQVNM